MESQSKLTFGNILVGLLLLGVVVVIGLIVFVYFALTKPESRHTTAVPANESANQQVERLSPAGGTLPPVPRSEASKVAAPTHNNAQQSDADKAVKDIKGTTTANQTVGAAGTQGLANAGALDAGEVRPKTPKTKHKPKPPKPPVATESVNDERVSQQNTNGAIQLEPINRKSNTQGERPLKPINSVDKPRETTSSTTRREPTPSRQPNQNSGERDLKPVQKTSPRSNDFDNLF